MVERNQLFRSMNILSDIMATRINGNFKEMINALLSFKLEDYKNIAQFVEESFGIDRESSKWKIFVEEIDKMPKCVECGNPVEKDDIGRDFGEGLFTCKRCEETF